MLTLTDFVKTNKAKIIVESIDPELADREIVFTKFGYYSLKTETGKLEHNARNHPRVMIKNRFPKRRQFDAGICSSSLCRKKILTPFVKFEDNQERTSVELQCPWCKSEVIGVIPRDLKLPPRCAMVKERYNYDQTVEIDLSRIGVALTTPVVMRNGDSNGDVLLRAGFAMMGTVNFECCIDANPFDTNFHDNYAEAIGASLEEAVDKLKDEFASLADILFH